MKTIIQLMFAGLIINATFQGGRSYYNFYRIEEESARKSCTDA